MLEKVVFTCSSSTTRLLLNSSTRVSTINTLSSTLAGGGPSSYVRQCQNKIFNSPASRQGIIPLQGGWMRNPSHHTSLQAHSSWEYFSLKHDEGTNLSSQWSCTAHPKTYLVRKSQQLLDLLCSHTFLLCFILSRFRRTYFSDTFYLLETLLYQQH